MRLFALLAPYHQGRVLARRFIERSLASTEAFATAIRRTQQFLPAGTTRRLAPPQEPLMYFWTPAGINASCSIPRTS
jgi:hypothetical protein